MDEIWINIAEAKAKLSQYIRRVKNGETIVLCERNVPVAEIQPIGLVEEGQSPYLKRKSQRNQQPQKKPGEIKSSQEQLHPAWGAMAGTVLEFADDFNEPEGDSDWEASK